MLVLATHVFHQYIDEMYRVGIDSMRPVIYRTSSWLVGFTRTFVVPLDVYSKTNYEMINTFEILPFFEFELISNSSSKYTHKMIEHTIAIFWCVVCKSFENILIRKIEFMIIGQVFTYSLNLDTSWETLNTNILLF